jgi:hypothetical protein
MKNKLTYLTALIVVVIFCAVLSCNQQNEVVPKDGDNNSSKSGTKSLRVGSTKEEYKKLELEEINQFSYQTQRIIVASLPGDYKYKHFRKKFETLLSQDRWSNEEKEHIKTLIAYLKLDMFWTKDVSVKDTEEYKYTMNWFNEGVKKFNWTEQHSVFFFATTYTDFAVVKDKSVFKKESTNGRISSASECYCAWQTCPEYYYCGDNKCEKTTSGCGWLLREACVGQCLWAL